MKCPCGCNTTELAAEPPLGQQPQPCPEELPHKAASLNKSVGTAARCDRPDGSLPPSAGDKPCSSSSGSTDAPPCGCAHEDADHEGMKRYEKIALAVAGLFVAIGLFAEHILGNELAMMAASAVAIVAGLVIILPETIESLKAKSIDINVLLVVAIIGAIYVQAYEEAAAVLFLFSVGEYLEGRAMRKSNDAIKDLAKLAPDTALVIRKGKTQEVPTDQVTKGEIFLVKPGMSVPLDGIIRKGDSSFNDAAITGESIPVHKEAGGKVYAASLAVDGSCEIEATSTVADSTLAKIAQMVQDAQKQKSAREHFVQRFAKVYTPLVIVAAVLVALVPPALSAFSPLDLGDLNTWIYRACELLVISCPCAFVISTPVTMVSALTRAAKFGALVKGGAFFEEGAEVVVAAFDKTGTLTEGRPVVTKAIPAPPRAQGTGPGDTDFYKKQLARLVSVAAGLESHSTHPLGEAVLGFASQQGIAAANDIGDVKETAGKGIIGTIDGRAYAIGSQGFIEERLNAAASIEGFAPVLEEEPGTALFVAELEPDQALLGMFLVSDAVRKEGSTVLSALHKVRKGIKTVMLTGDNAKVAQAVAAVAGVDEVHASLMPQGKTAEIKRLQETVGPVAYTGDGINDAPSLATANVGIAMGGAGSAAALSSADVVLMADDLSALPKFFSLSTKTVAVLKQNVVLAIGLKVLVALLVVVGVAQMWMAVLADTGVSLLVILNGMLLLRRRL